VVLTVTISSVGVGSKRLENRRKVGGRRLKVDCSNEEEEEEEAEEEEAAAALEI
jgi:hypothetical protein